MQDLILDLKRVCLEYEKLQNKSIWREVRYKVLLEKLKDELCRAMLMQQEEGFFEVDSIMKKIDDEHELDTTLERCEKSHNNE